MDPGRLAVGGDSAGGNLAAVVAVELRDTPVDLRFQLLIYPVTDGTMTRPSIDANAEGYFLTKDTMDWFWEQYVGAGDRTRPAGVADAPARRGAARACRRRSSSPPSTTRCATRARPTAPGSSGPGCR